MTDQERKKYPELARVSDLKEEHGEQAFAMVQDVIEHLAERVFFCDFGEDERYWPINKSVEQLVYEYWGVDYAAFKKQYNDRWEELLAEQAH